MFTEKYCLLSLGKQDISSISNLNIALLSPQTFNFNFSQCKLKLFHLLFDRPPSSTASSSTTFTAVPATADTTVEKVSASPDLMPTSTLSTVSASSAESVGEYAIYIAVSVPRSELSPPFRHF